jgi:DNA-binding transcriptional MocR family regulator
MADHEDHFLYEQLASELSQAIDRGALRPGDKLPSVRRLAEERGVSVATVLQAYLRLENTGLIEVRPKSGHFVRRRTEVVAEPRPPRTCATPARVSVSDAVARVHDALRDPGVVPLGSAYVDPAMLPVSALNRMLAQLAREASTAGARYDVAPGLLTLRRQLARRSVDWGVPLGEDEFVTTIGASEGLTLALRAVAKAGDVIAVESPTYFGVLQAIEGLGMRALEIPAHPRTGLDVEALEEALRTQPIRALMVNANVSNPLGSIMPDEAKERVVKLARRHDVPVIEDDVYGELVFDGSRPRPLRAFDPAPDSRVVLVGSVSKTLAPGYRVGWCAAGRWHEQVLRLKYSQSLACPTLTQMAVAEFLGSGGYDRHLRRLRSHLSGQVDRYRGAVIEAFPEGTRVSSPRGGFVLWIEMPAGVDALELQDRALARSIVISPGPIFSARNRFGNFVRISAGTPWNPKVEAAIKVLGQLVDELAGRRGRGGQRAA